jgi:hypothetical protein
MPTRALAIRDAILTTLRASAVAGIPAARIYADLRDAIHTRPSIVVDLGDEDAPTNEYGKRRRTVALTVRILADGADPFTSIDAIRIAAHTRIMADKTLAGKCETIEEGASSRDRADMDVMVGSLTTVYTARYTTTAELLT